MLNASLPPKEHLHDYWYLAKTESLDALKIRFADGTVRTMTPLRSEDTETLSLRLREMAAICATQGRTLEYHEQSREFVCGPVRRGRDIVGTVIAE
jgi:hypothetical protein